MSSSEQGTELVPVVDASGPKGKKPTKSGNENGTQSVVRDAQDNSTANVSHKRKKPRHRNATDNHLSNVPGSGVSEGLSAWQTIVAFRTPSGKAFDRVLDAGYNLHHVRQMVANKYKISPSAPMNLAYLAPDGSQIDLDDNEDFRAFQVHAAREATITVHVHFPETSQSLPSQPQSAVPHGKTSRGRRGGSTAHRSEDIPEDSASAIEVSQFFDADQPSNEQASALPTSSSVKRQRKRKTDTVANHSTQDTSSNAKPPTDPSPAAVESDLSHVVPASSAVDQHHDDSEEDLPLSSQTTLPSSQPTDAQEKPKRVRRTKAEMELFRAEKAAKKAAKEQDRLEKQHGIPHGSDDATSTAPVDLSLSVAPDDTVIMHDAPAEEFSEGALAAVDALTEQGTDAMQSRLTDLKSKKQRKNAQEREEQKLLVSRLKHGKASSKDADQSTRELPPNFARANTDAQPSLPQRALDAATSLIDRSQLDSDASEETANESHDYFSQPESHASRSQAQLQGPSPRPSEPLESTPQRAMQPQSTDPSTSRRTMSGAFTKLSDLRPSALRRSFSRTDSNHDTSAASQRASTAPQPPANMSEDEQSETTESSANDVDSSDEDTPTTSTLPAWKQAGAQSEASALDASKAKKKRSFFSVLS
ncbi:hypothetical protein MYAM1_003516 [Malassezia yamatoensis]|uniref:Uncharacterized protein n=1 Tax=Malassezia yamatoensis TaxID=253288 RepID=A0AAJ5YWV6_9BASI|nr:hypothetical protein MYAM1_003516 [Malassezia yamatoensis]